MDLDSREQTGLAVQHLSALLAEFPEASRLHCYLAWLLSRTGPFGEAIEHARQAVLLSPQSEVVSVVFFTVLWRAGERMEAFDEMKRFVATRRPAKVYSGMIKAWEEEEAPSEQDMGDQS